MIAAADGGGGGADGFQVVLADLLDASATFHTEAGTLKAVVPVNGPPCPDGGDAALNQNLKVVLEMIGTLNLQASGVIDGDSAKLKTAHDRYASTETSLTQLCTEISDPSKIG
jgi:hypothetical protein